MLKGVDQVLNQQVSTRAAESVEQGSGGQLCHTKQFSLQIFFTKSLCTPDHIDFIGCVNLAVLWADDHNYNMLHSLRK